MQKIQNYRLVRENILKWQKQRQVNRKEMRRHKLDIYEKMQVSVDLPVSAVVKHQILNVSACLQSNMFQVVLRFSQAMKGCSEGGDRKEDSRGSGESPE